jgi:acyl carrier protein
MAMSDFEAQVLRMVEGVALKKVDLDEPLLDSGLVDSISAVDLALMMETEFGVAMPAERIHEYMRTVRTLADHVATHR